MDTASISIAIVAISILMGCAGVPRPDTYKSCALDIAKLQHSYTSTNLQCVKRYSTIQSGPEWESFLACVRKRDVISSAINYRMFQCQQFINQPAKKPEGLNT